MTIFRPGWRFALDLVVAAVLAWLDRIGGETPEPPTSNGVQTRHDF